MSRDGRRLQWRSGVGERRGSLGRRRAGVWGVLFACAASQAGAVPVLVKDINPGPASSGPAWLTELNGTLLLAADDGASGVELWGSDGTVGGTVLVKDVNPAGPSGPNQLFNLDGTVFFGADTGTGTSFADLWKSDGTTAGTVLVDADPGFLFGSLIQMTNAGGTLYFLEYHGGGTVSCCTVSLWKSDGTAAGTELITYMGQVAGLFGPIPDFVEWVPELGSVFFALRMGPIFALPAQLWKTDGTVMELVRDTWPTNLQRVGGTLFFSSGLWKSDGTTAGTVSVSGVTPLPVDDHVGMNGLLFFNATDGSTGNEMWRSDGTTAGKDINPGSASALDTTFIRTYANPFVEMETEPRPGRRWWRTSAPAGPARIPPG